MSASRACTRAHRSRRHQLAPLRCHQPPLLHDACSPRPRSGQHADSPQRGPKTLPNTATATDTNPATTKPVSQGQGHQPQAPAYAASQSPSPPHFLTSPAARLLASSPLLLPACLPAVAYRLPAPLVTPGPRHGRHIFTRHALCR